MSIYTIDLGFMWDEQFWKYTRIPQKMTGEQACCVFSRRDTKVNVHNMVYMEMKE